MSLKVGDKVRVTTDEFQDSIPQGTEGTVREIVFDHFLFVEAPGLEKPLGTYGDGWALTSDEVEVVEVAA